MMEEMPYLERIRFWATHVGEEIAALEQVSIRVQRADPNLMFRVAKNVDPPNFLREPSDPELTGSRTEYFYPINTDGVPGERREWSLNQVFTWGQFVRDIFRSHITDWCSGPKFYDLLGEDPFEVVGSIVWVSSTIWHRRLKDHNLMPIGEAEPVRAEIDITVYKAPKQGWRSLYLKADPLVNVTLSGHNLWPNQPRPDSFRLVALDLLDRLAIKFDAEVMREGLWKMIVGTKCVSGMIGDVRVTASYMIGQYSISLESGDSQVSFVGIEHLHQVGFEGIQGTLPSVFRMVDKVCARWPEMSEGERRGSLTEASHEIMGL